MDLNTLIAPVATFILGIGIVWKFLSKFTPAAKKYIGIASNALGLLDVVLKAIEDKKIDGVEISAIRKEAEELMVSIGKK